jgi:hypothetical protein
MQSVMDGHTPSLFRRLNISNLFDLNKFQIGYFMYKCMYCMLHQPFQDSFVHNCCIREYSASHVMDIHTKFQ